MSIFGSILSKIFSHPAAAAAPAPDAAPDAPADVPADATPAAAAPAAAAPDAATASPAPAAAPVDVEAVLTDLASKNPQTLNWKSSIVDLMKLLDLDSSLKARTELAGELHYTGDTNDSASMNIWLHKAVMQKLEENGGKVPDDLKG